MNLVARHPLSLPSPSLSILGLHRGLNQFFFVKFPSATMPSSAQAVSWSEVISTEARNSTDCVRCAQCAHSDTDGKLGATSNVGGYSFQPSLGGLEWDIPRADLPQVSGGQMGRNYRPLTGIPVLETIERRKLPLWLLVWCSTDENLARIQ